MRSGFWGVIVFLGLIVGTGSALLVWRGFEFREIERLRAKAKASPTIASPSTTRPGAGPKRPGVPLFTAGFIDDSGYELALNYTPAIGNRGSITEVAAAYRERSQRGRADILRKLDALERSVPHPLDFDQRRALLQVFAGLIGMYEGDFPQAETWFARAMIENPGMDVDFRTNIGAMRGVAALRRGEVDNCVACLGPSNCIFPIAIEAKHLKPGGSTDAIRFFTEYLNKRPEDLGVRWLLNVAAMTLGESIEMIPVAYRVPSESTETRPDVGRFVNVAAEVGLSSRGPNMLGGSLFDDFTGDGRPDIFLVSGDWDLGGSLFVNKGDGTFVDRGKAAGLDDQVLAVNATHADYDNDGWLDVLTMRGGWEAPSPLSLLRNKGAGVFEDVTFASGLGEPIACQSAAWGDYDNDGFLDLYVAGEFRDKPFDPRNRCRLYRNRGDGTFIDMAAKAGVQNERWAKGVTWGDYDDDGFIDLYVSNMNGLNRLYHNNHDGTFTDVAEQLNLTGPLRSFACWFWDYDNDGRLDLFVTGFSATVYDVVADRLGQPTDADRPRLYRNLGQGKFENVALNAGLDHAWIPMGANFADFDNDGYLDIYLGTGRPAYSYLVPNVLLRNVAGERFEDVTTASGTGHLQKGHGVSFADYDEDGDLDLLVEIGGQTPGDRANNALFRNPGHGRHWLAMRLVGTKANRSAIGAKLRLDLVMNDGTKRVIHRVINGGSSFGGNSLAPLIGLGDAKTVETLAVTWPGSGTIQTFSNLSADQSIEITEGTEAYRVVKKPANPTDANK